MKCDRKASRACAIVAALVLPLFVGGCFRAKPPLTPPAHSGPNYEAYIALRWDAAANAVVRTFNASAVADDADLVRRLVAAKADHAKSATSKLTVTIDAASAVPWEHVVTAINACRRAGLEDVEFAFGAGK